MQNRHLLSLLLIFSTGFAWSMSNGAGPSNDLCSNATPIICGETISDGTTTDATADDAPSNCFSLGQGVWYSIEGTGDEITLVVSPDDWDPELSLLSGTCGNLTGIECEDVGLNGGPETVVIESQLGTTYYLYVADWSERTSNENAGDFTISATCPEPCEENEVTVDMSDEFGDGWNGNLLEIIDEGDNVVATATITSGSSGSETFCLPDGCYTVDVDGGLFQNEVSWEISVNENPVLSGGAPESGLALAINADCSDSGLPAPWTATDLGNPGNGNEYGFEAGTFTATSVGNSRAFISQTLCGSGSISVKIDNVNGNGFGGLAMRESIALGAKQVVLLNELNGILPWITRTVHNGPNNRTSFWAPFSSWIKLERIGNYIRGSYSTDGNSFVPIALSYVPMDDCIEVGMITVNRRGGQTTVNYSDVNVVGGGGPALAADEITEAAMMGRDKTVPFNTPGFEQPAAVEAARLFPNPASSRITIDLPAAQPMEATLTLRNQLGQALQTRQVEAGLFRADWDVSQLSGGVYFMEVRYEGQQPQVLRFVKTN